jgi:hypothetical protein
LKIINSTKNASVVVVVVSERNFGDSEKPSKTYQFDACAAWKNLALEAASVGLVATGMKGLGYEKARPNLEIPDTFDVMAMIAIGKKGPKENLPPKLQEKEYPSDRKSLGEIVMEGHFKT